MVEKQSEAFHTFLWHFFPSWKQNFIVYSSSKVSSCPDGIFEIHQLWQSGFRRVYSNCCCSCSFEPEIIKISQSCHKMYRGGMIKLLPEKNNMIPFPVNENCFSFFVADHLLVGQLCTNPKSDRSLLSCLKVTQCSTSVIGDVPLYNSYLSTDPSYDNRTIASTLKLQIQTVQHLRAQLNAADNSLEVVKWKPKAEDATRKPQTKEFIEKVQAIIDEIGDPLVQSGGQWQTLDVAAGLGAGPQVERDPGFTSEGVLRLCTLFSLAPLLSWPEPIGLLRLVIHRDNHQHDFPQHQSQPDCHHLPSIRQAPTGACGKGMLSVLDPYQGGNWGWRWLHWVDVSSTT